MRQRMVSFLNILIFLLIAGLLAASAVFAAPAPAGDHLAVSGLVTNPMGKGLKEVEVEVLVNGQHVKPTGKEAEIVTGKPGGFVADFILPPGTLPAAKVEVKAAKPSWKPIPATPVKVVEAGSDAQGNKLFQAVQNLTLNRTITPGFWIAALVLLLVYVVISLELMHRTLVSFLGAALILFVTYTLGTFDKSFHIISFDDAMGAIDLNVIFLLMGMMLFVGVMKKTGMFQFLAYKAYALAKGNVFVLSLFLQVITAVVSAFLDNVTTMLLVLPVTIEIAVTLKINPMTLLIPEVFASNVGGTATLIGDPPNILIGSYAGLTFGQFVQNLTLVCTVCLAVSSLWYLWWHKKDYLKAEVKDIPRTIAYLKEEYQITNKKLTIQGLAPPGLHHRPVRHPRHPAHAGVGGRAHRLAHAGGRLRGGHRGTAGKRGGVAHPGLLHRLVHGHRRGRRNRPDPDDRQLGEGRLPGATSPQPSSSSCGSAPSPRPSSTTFPSPPPCCPSSPS